MPVPFDPHPQFAQYAHPERLVSASWLSARLGTPGLRVVESDEDALLYDIGHLPSAVRIDWRRDLSHPVTRDIIDGEAFAALMRAKGIRRDDTVVIYGDRANSWAAYTLWVFTLFGHPDVRILDGGRDAWMAEERDTSYAVPEYPESDYPVVPRLDAPARAFFSEILAGTRTGGTQILDVRSPEEFSGNTAPRPGVVTPVQRTGHIPGAVNRNWASAVYPNSNFRSRDEIAQAFGQLDPQAPTVTYCQLGDRSAHSWFVLTALLGFEQVRNYDGSWAEWGNMIAMPIEVGAGPSGDATKDL